jgi:hypothetical protein
MLTDILIDIQQRETGAPIPKERVAELRELAAEFAVEDKPPWLLSMFKAVQQGQAVSSPVFFERENSDPYSYMGEAAELLGWKYGNEGEYEVVEFTNLGWRIYISNEASSPTGKSGSKYVVTPLRPQP